MRRNRWLAVLGLVTVLSPLMGGCDGILSACVYNGGYGPCDEDVPQDSCERAGGIYHNATTCDDLGMLASEPPPGSD